MSLSTKNHHPRYQNIFDSHFRIIGVNITQTSFKCMCNSFTVWRCKIKCTDNTKTTVLCFPFLFEMLGYVVDDDGGGEKH